MSMANSKIPTCYASCSIGTKAEHDLPAKLEAISSAGFDAIELSLPDLLSFANSYMKKEVSSYDYPELCEAGKKVRELCEENKLKVLILQPFSNFEGWPDESPEKEDAWKRAKGWMQIMEAVGTDMLQVGSSDSPNIKSSQTELAHDLAQLADLLAPKGFRIAYENWCWATHAPTWKTVWQIVQKAGRPNIGLCLDTFQTGGSEWADPTTQSGLIETVGRDELEKNFHASLRELSATVPKDKIYFLQISDAYKVDPPLSPEPDESGLRARGRWSHDYRPLPFDGGYLPVVEVTQAVLKTGFRGWFSVEIFDAQMQQKHGDDMARFAKKAMATHERLLKEAGVE